MVIQFIGAYDVVKFLKGEASCRFATDGTHKDYWVKPWSGKACRLIALKSEVPDTETNEARISDNPLRIPPLSLHSPTTILSKVEPVVGLVGSKSSDAQVDKHFRRRRGIACGP